MVERITVTVRPPEGAAFVSAQEAMLQAADFFALLEASTPLDDGKRVAWRLVHASTNSPFTATAEAFSTSGNDVTGLAQVGKRRVENGLRSVLSGGPPPEWLGPGGNALMAGLLTRSRAAIGSTTLAFNDNAEVVTIGGEEALKAALLLNQSVSVLREAPRLPEFGSIEGSILQAAKREGRPVIRVRERLSGRDVACFLTDAAAEVFGKTELSDVWEGRRVLVLGSIHYGAGDTIARVEAEEVQEVEDTNPNLAAAQDRNFTGGMSVSDYLDFVRGE